MASPRKANLRRVNLRRANLRRANLRRANLRRVNPRRVNPRRVNPWRAKLKAIPAKKKATGRELNPEVSNGIMSASRLVRSHCLWPVSSWVRKRNKDTPSFRTGFNLVRKDPLSESSFCKEE
ncbi:MAG: pentapeptide repeat-containing protein [Firmicutes bacterium]|nr:pentapeptide repeat-containing protein [Bacillota bacterium]